MPSDSTLTLFIPDLFGFQSTLSKLSSDEISQLPEIKIPTLERWLSRGLFENSSDQIDSVFADLGFGEYQNQDKPYAALSLLAENNLDNDFNSGSFWLRADPVNLQADRDTALLVAHEEIALTQEEANKLVAQINEHFIDEPWQLYTFAPHRWYLRLDKRSDLKTTPLDKVLGGDISAFSPIGDDADYWFNIINELQMLIHGSNVNFERESKNMITANSVWLWGAGYLPEVKLEPSYNKMITNNIIFSGLGYHCDFEVLPLDSTFVEKIKTNNNFVVLDMLSEQLQRRDLYTFVQELNKLEENYFLGCDELLTSGNIDKIKLITDAGTLIVTKKMLGRWWKRSKSFTGFNYE